MCWGAVALTGCLDLQQPLQPLTASTLPHTHPAPTLQVAKRELALECNYSYEAAAQARFRDLVAGDPQLAGTFYVPQVSWLGVENHGYVV